MTETKFLGFRVRGTPPRVPMQAMAVAEPLEDLFQLRQAAEECRERLIAENWTHVTVASLVHWPPPFHDVIETEIPIGAPALNPAGKSPASAGEEKMATNGRPLTKGAPTSKGKTAPMKTAGKPDGGTKVAGKHAPAKGGKPWPG